MLQRTNAAAFLPGAFVFPGGALDPDDASPRAARRVRGLDDAQASARMGLASGGLAYWVAAARECFEESGILLAFDEGNSPIDPERVARLENLRKPQWKSLTTGYVDAFMANPADILEWYTDPRCGGWRVMRRETELLGPIVDASGVGIKGQIGIVISGD